MPTKCKFTFVLTILFLAIPLTTSAAKPDSGGGTFFFPGDPLVDCGDFWILDNTLMRVSWRDFYDEEGNWVRSEAHYSFKDDLYHEGFPEGTHILGNSQANHQWYVKDGEMTAHKVSGLPVAITVPGYGPLFFEAGMWIGVDGELVFVAGKHKDWVEQDVDAICGYFRNQ
jgi:hypothetical protein